MKKFCSIFKIKKPAIGMIHLGALPGTPKYAGSINKLVDDACKEAEIYKSSSVDSVMIENMNDIPYIRPPDFLPETVAVMSKISSEIKRILPKETPCGIQVLAGGNKEAISIAKACDLQFIRAEGFVFSHIGDEGFLDASAGPLLRYRKSIDAESVLVFTDIKKKHSSHEITSDVCIEETAQAAQFFLSDGIILTGSSTGSPADQDELTRVSKTVNIPVIIGSGITNENVEKYKLADAFIVGSSFKENGSWDGSLAEDKVKNFMEKIWDIRSNIYS